MANEILERDQNRVTVLGGVTDDSNEYITQLRINPTTGRLLVSATGLTALAVGVEIPVGLVNGSNTVFTVSNTPVFMDVGGQVMVSSTTDPTNYGYTYLAGTVTFVNAPPTGQTPHSYYNGVGGAVLGSYFETDTFTSTAGQTVFTTTLVPTFVFTVIVNDQPQTLTTDYTQSGSTFTLNSGIPAGLKVLITYVHS